jgi:hypothetical protein
MIAMLGVVFYLIKKHHPKIFVSGRNTYSCILVYQLYKLMLVVVSIGLGGIRFHHGNLILDIYRGLIMLG